MTEYDDEELEQDEADESEDETPRLDPDWCSLCEGRGRLLGQKCPLCSGKGRLRAASRRLRTLLGMWLNRSRRGGRRGPRRRLGGQHWPVLSVGGYPVSLPGVRTFGRMPPEMESPERVPEMLEPEKVEEVSWPEYAPDYVAEAALSFGVPGGVGDVEVQVPEAEISLLAPPDRPLIVSASAVVDPADLAGPEASPLALGDGLQVVGAPEPPLVTEINYDVAGLPVEVSPGVPLEIGIVGL